MDPLGTGFIDEGQAAALVRRVVPDVTPGELRYFWSMVDADGAPTEFPKTGLTLSEAPTPCFTAAEHRTATVA